MAVEIDAIQNGKSIGWADALLARLAAGSIQTPKLTIAGGTITTDLPVVNGSVTWNAGGVTFTADKINVTDTASAAGSLLIDRQVGGASRFKVAKDGSGTLATFTIPEGNATRSILASFINQSDVVGAGNDYENEVHVVLKAGTASNHRRYIDFKNYDNTDAYLVGVNASNNFILYDSSLGHRMHGTTAGVTQLNSFSTEAVEINNYPGSDVLGTGGLKVYSGGALGGRELLFHVEPTAISANKQIVQSSSQDTTQLNLTGTGTGYAPASILLTATQSTTRGQGVFYYNTESDTSWFCGVPYNSAGAKWMVGFQSAGTWGADVADVANAIVVIDTNASANDTGLLLYADGSLKRVVLGAADSGGTGYRLLRVAN